MKHTIDRGDITQTAVVDGHVRVNLGDQVEGKGYTASRPLWASDGFRGRPNAPTSTGAAQALFVTLGNDRVILAARDARFIGPFGDLGEGDREIVSDCDAGFRLDKSGNAIRLSSTGVDVVLDGTAGTITATKGTAEIKIATVAAVDAITLTVGPTVLTVDATGVNVVGILKVGGVPLTVP